MSKNKRRPIKRFCEICQKRIIFNKTREDKLVCSRCGVTFTDEKEWKTPKVFDGKSLNT